MIELQHTLAHPEQLKALYEQSVSELEAIQPRIEELEKAVQELRELRTMKQRLLTLKMSLAALIEGITKDNVDDFLLGESSAERLYSETKLYDYSELSALKTFHPERALSEVSLILKQKNSLNAEMFKAVVFNGGKASTEEIKRYLVETGAKQPQTGEGFEAVPLTEISSRANYLVRKGVLQPMGRGDFYCTLGWVDPE